MPQRDHGGGFSLSARVRIEATDREGLESEAQGWPCLARRGRNACYGIVPRPIFAGERLEWVTPGQRLLYHLPNPGLMVNTLSLTPLEWLEGSPCSSRPRAATAGGHMASWRVMSHSCGGDRTGWPPLGDRPGRAGAPLQAPTEAQEELDTRPRPRPS